MDPGLVHRLERTGSLFAPTLTELFPAPSLLGKAGAAEPGNSTRRTRAEAN